MKLAQKFGSHSLLIDNLFVNYDFPQEGSNKTDVRWVEFSTFDPPEMTLIPLVYICGMSGRTR